MRAWGGPTLMIGSRPAITVVKTTPIFSLPDQSSLAQAMRGVPPPV